MTGIIVREAGGELCDYEADVIPRIGELFIYDGYQYQVFGVTHKVDDRAGLVVHVEVGTPE